MLKTVEISRKITLLYITALTLIGLLSVSAYLVIRQLSSINVTDGKLINLSGRQRMLSQKLAKNILLLKYHIQPDKTAGILTEIRADFNEWQNVHAGLKEKDITQNRLAIGHLADISNLITSLETPYNTMQRFILHQLDHGKPASQSQLDDYLNAEMDFLNIMDEITNRLENRTSAKLENLLHIEFIVLCLTLLMLLSEGFFIYRPAVRRLKTLFSELENANLRLREISEIKENFFTTAAHDLRSPFNAILGFSDLLLKDKSLSAEHHDMVETIKTAAELQLAYISEIFELIKLEAGNYKLNLSRCNMEDIIRSTVKNLKVLADKKNIRLHADKIEMAAVYADPVKISQVLNNLISNAIKFTPRGKSIEIRSIKNAFAQLEIHVIDQGIGISIDHQDKVFNKYKKILAHGTDGEPGTGLGLYICRMIVEMHKGEIGLESELGRGSDFYFKLQVMRE